MLSYLVRIVFDVIFVLVASFGYEFIPFIDVDPFYSNILIYIYIYIYSQGLCIKRVCSRKEDFEKHMQELSGWLRNRAYPTWLIEKEFKRVNKEYNLY